VKFGMHIIPMKAIPPLYFKFLAINNTNMTTFQTSGMELTCILGL